MLNWLRRILINRQRAVFRFWDGAKMRRIDPMVVYYALCEHPEFDWEKTPLLIDVDDTQIMLPAMQMTAAAVRSSFLVGSLEQGGLTDGECVQLLTAFNRYMLALKKSASPLATSPESTEPPASDVSTMKHDSDCFSMSTAPRFDGQPAS